MSDSALSWLVFLLRDDGRKLNTCICKEWCRGIVRKENDFVEQGAGFGDCEQVFCGSEIFHNCHIPWLQNMSYSGELKLAYHTKGTWLLVNGKFFRPSAREVKLALDYWMSVEEHENTNSALQEYAFTVKCRDFHTSERDHPLYSVCVDEHGRWNQDLQIDEIEEK